MHVHIIPFLNIDLMKTIEKFIPKEGSGLYTMHSQHQAA